MPLVHKITQFYKNIYCLGKNLPKKDRFGLFSKIEETTLGCLKLSIEAALSAREIKLPILQKIKIEVEVIKRLVRLAQELNIINTKTYLSLEEQLQEISRMTTGWIKYLDKKEP